MVCCSLMISAHAFLKKTKTHHIEDASAGFPFTETVPRNRSIMVYCGRSRALLTILSVSEGSGSILPLTCCSFARHSRLFYWDMFCCRAHHRFTNQCVSACTEFSCSLSFARRCRTRKNNVCLPRFKLLFEFCMPDRVS